MNKQVLCKDCEFYRKNLDADDAASCYHPAALARLDLVNGFNDYNTCRNMRETVCKVSAKLFKRIGTL